MLQTASMCGSDTRHFKYTLKDFSSVHTNKFECYPVIIQIVKGANRPEGCGKR